MREDFYRYVLYYFFPLFVVSIKIVQLPQIQKHLHYYRAARCDMKLFTCFTNGLRPNAIMYCLVKSHLNNCIYLCSFGRQSLTLILVYIINKGKFLLNIFPCSAVRTPNKLMFVQLNAITLVWVFSGRQVLLLYILYVPYLDCTLECCCKVNVKWSS